MVSGRASRSRSRTRERPLLPWGDPHPGICDLCSARTICHEVGLRRELLCGLCWTVELLRRDVHLHARLLTPDLRAAAFESVRIARREIGEAIGEAEAEATRRVLAQARAARPRSPVGEPRSR